MSRYITALLKSSGPRLNQVSSLNSFCGWNSLLSVRLQPVRSDDDDRAQHIEAETGEDLLLR